MALVNREKVNRLQRMMQLGLAGVYCVSLLIAVSVKAETGEPNTKLSVASSVLASELQLADEEKLLP